MRVLLFCLSFHYIPSLITLIFLFRYLGDYNLLEILAKEHCKDLLEELLQGEFSHLFCSEGKHAAMVRAIEKGHDEILNVFLDNGCDPNFTTKEGIHVLNIAAHKSFACTHCLLARGATFQMSVAYLDGYGTTFVYNKNYRMSPVDVAILFGRYSIAKLLFLRFHIPPTYRRQLNEGTNNSNFKYIFSKIDKSVKAHEELSEFKEIYFEQPRPLLRLCMEKVSGLIGPTSRKKKLSDCGLPVNISHEILLEGVCEQEYL